MNPDKKLAPDFKGEVRFMINSEFRKVLPSGTWGAANIQGKDELNSFIVYLIDREMLLPGEVSKGEFRYRSSSDKNFKVDLSLGDVLELRDGRRKFGEFLIERILNEQFLQD